MLDEIIIQAFSDFFFLPIFDKRERTQIILPCGYSTLMFDAIILFQDERN